MPNTESALEREKKSENDLSQQEKESEDRLREERKIRGEEAIKKMVAGLPAELRERLEAEEEAEKQRELEKARKKIEEEAQAGVR